MWVVDLAGEKTLALAAFLRQVIAASRFQRVPPRLDGRPIPPAPSRLLPLLAEKFRASCRASRCISKAAPSWG